MEITLEKALKKQRTQEAKIQEIFKQNKEFQEKIKSFLKGFSEKIKKPAWTY